MNFVGVIIAESLRDKSLLDDVKIISTKVELVEEEHKTPWIKQWTLYKIEVRPEEAVGFAERVSKTLDGQHQWYADYKNKQEHFIIYRDKVFHVTDRSDALQYADATAYGISVGIPDYQVDFSQYILERRR